LTKQVFSVTFELESQFDDDDDDNENVIWIDLAEDNG